VGGPLALFGRRSNSFRLRKLYSTGISYPPKRVEGIVVRGGWLFWYSLSSHTREEEDEAHGQDIGVFCSWERGVGSIAIEWNRRTTLPNAVS
jgi:hypothetical protein